MCSLRCQQAFVLDGVHLSIPEVCRPTTALHVWCYLQICTCLVVDLVGRCSVTSNEVEAFRDTLDLQIFTANLSVCCGDFFCETPLIVIICITLDAAWLPRHCREVAQDLANLHWNGSRCLLSLSAMHWRWWDCANWWVEMSMDHVSIHISLTDRRQRVFCIHTKQYAFTVRK